MQKQFRPNAAVIITNSKKEILLCERGFPGYAEHTVQTVQGGIDEGETPREAAEREMMEELGVEKESFEIIDELEETFSYEWPEESQARYPGNPYVGQEQHFFLAMLHDAIEFNLDAHHREFDAVRWGSATELLEGMWEPKRAGTEAALKAFGFFGDK
ncbi:MAG: NUDIX domain-containing protein [Patescibacteria group bacterium]